MTRRTWRTYLRSNYNFSQIPCFVLAVNIRWGRQKNTFEVAAEVQLICDIEAKDSSLYQLNTYVIALKVNKFFFNLNLPNVVRIIANGMW
jgi:hypothetical protein